jgi:uncharacterized protein (DUF608 family)
MSKKIQENITKGDVKKEIKAYIDTNDFEKKIEKIVKDRIKNEKDLEDKVVDITKNVLVQLYKTLWIKKAVWKDNLSNKSS